MTINIDQIETWIFDLDNTLYPASSKLFDQISSKMTQFIMAELQINKKLALVVQKKYFRAHGTTLRGLMINHNIDPLCFLKFVHDIDLSPINKQNTLLDSELKRLPGRKVIFTNGSVEHAQNVTKHMGIDHHFDYIFDIVASNYIPKPSKQVYKEMVAKLNINPNTAVMIEDMACNLIPASDMGMTTVWVRSEIGWAAKDSQCDQIDYRVNDLPKWLSKLK